MVKLKRSLKNEARLRHGTLGCIDKKNNAVYHFEDTLDLAAEVCVTGCVDYVYFYAFIVYCRIFGKDGYTSFSFDIAGIHYSFRRFLIFTVNAALLEHLVNKGRFTVVNVCYYGYVSQIFSYHWYHS